MLPIGYIYFTGVISSSVLLCQLLLDLRYFQIDRRAAKTEVKKSKKIIDYILIILAHLYDISFQQVAIKHF